MRILKNKLSNEVWELYQKTKEGLEEKSKKLEVILKRPHFSDGAAAYLQDKQGNYEIYVDPKYLKDFVFSHELLHIDIKENASIPELITIEEGAGDTSRYIALLHMDAVEHKWILAEQRRMGINGEKDYVQEFFANLLEQEYKEAGNITGDFLLTGYLFSFMNDFPEHIELCQKKLQDKYPVAAKNASEIVNDLPDLSSFTPYYLKRYIVKSINKWIELLSRDYLNCNFIRQDIIVPAVFRDIQLDVQAEALIGIFGEMEKYFLYTLADYQKCGPNYSPDKTPIEYIQDLIATETVRAVFEELELSYYLDNRDGTWSKG